MKTRGWPDGEIQRKGVYISVGPYVTGQKRDTLILPAKSKSRRDPKFPPLPPKPLPALAVAALLKNPIQREPDGSLDVAVVILSRFIKHQRRSGKFVYMLKELPGVWLFRPCCYSVAQRKVQSIIRRYVK